MTKSDKKLFMGLIDRLVILLQESEDMFFEERPFIMSGGKAVITESEFRKENDSKIKKVNIAIQALLDKYPKEGPKGEQISIDTPTVPWYTKQN